MRRPALHFLIVTLIFTMAAPPSAAQTQPLLDVRLEDFPSWVGPGDSLRAVFRITNRGDSPATSLRVVVAVHEGVATRSHLERTLAGRLGAVEVSDSVAVDGQIDPGATRTVVVEKPLSEFRFFQSAPEDRVHPVRFVVRSGSTASRPVDSHMIFFSKQVDVPLKVGLIIPLHVPPIYDPSLRVVPDRVRDTSGRLSKVLDALKANSAAAITLAPSGLLLDTLSDLADGYTTVDGDRIGREDESAAAASSSLDVIRELAAESGDPLIASPYSQAHLAWLNASGLSERAAVQTAATRAAISDVLGIDAPDEWLLPTAGALDESTLTFLQRNGVSKIAVSSEFIARRATPLTPQAPIRIQARTGAVDALGLDAVLGRRFTQAPGISAVQARQRFLAETASIMLERPAEDRVVFAAAPPDWAPTAALLGGILDALIRSPWMSGVTPSSIGEIANPPTVSLAPNVTVLAGLGELPPASYSTQLLDARRAIKEFESLGPPGERVDRMNMKLMVAEGSDWWSSRQLLSRGERFARTVITDVAREFSKIKAPARQVITLTSRTGVIPLVVSNDTGYPVRIVIRLDSDKLRFPGGSRLTHLLETPAKTIDVEAITDTSGTFPLRVVVETPDGSREVSTSTVRVRSTAYNVIAVAITGGAGLFLVVWWLFGVYRRRHST